VYLDKVQVDKLLGGRGGGDEELMRMRREVMMLKLERERGRMREESKGNSSHCSEYST